MGSWDYAKAKRYNPEKEGYGNPGEWKRAFKGRMSPDEARSILQEEDPWVILGIPYRSTKEVIKKAYRKLAIQWHPDKNIGNELYATEMMKKINAAYSLIS